MKKELREKVYQKFNGHCAYCGEEITYEQMQVDHIKPIYRGVDHKINGILYKVNIKNRGTDTLDNCFPSCRSCNNYKTVWSLEEFRTALENQLNVLRKQTAYKRALRYGLVKEKPHKIKFYFEIKEGS